MNKIVLSIVLIFVVSISNAQQTANINLVSNDLNLSMIQEPVVDTSWKSGGIFGLNFGQTAMKNWAAGGENSVAIGALFSYFKNYKKDKNAWDNNIDLAYGVMQQGDKVFIKTDDKIDVSTKYGRQLGAKNWFLTGLGNFKTQFTDGYADPYAANEDLVSISKFMAPGYALASLGLDYKPNDNFSFYISPITAKFTFVNDQKLADAGSFGVTGAEFDDLGNMTKSGENFRSEFGAYIKTMYKKDILENVAFITKLDMFANYEDITHIDVSWDNLLSMKVNKFITATVGATVLYDHDIDIARVTGTDEDGLDVTTVGPTTQFKEVLTVGFAYKF